MNLWKDTITTVLWHVYDYSIVYCLFVVLDGQTLTQTCLYVWYVYCVRLQSHLNNLFRLNSMEESYSLYLVRSLANQSSPEKHRRRLSDGWCGGAKLSDKEMRGLRCLFVWVLKETGLSCCGDEGSHVSGLREGARGPAVPRHWCLLWRPGWSAYTLNPDTKPASCVNNRTSESCNNCLPWESLGWNPTNSNLKLMVNLWTYARAIKPS